MNTKHEGWGIIFVRGFCLPPGAPHFVLETFQGLCYRDLGQKNTAWVYQGSQERVESRRRVKGSTEIRELQRLCSFSGWIKPRFLTFPFLISLNQLCINKIRRICSVSEGIWWNCRSAPHVLLPENADFRRFWELGLAHSQLPNRPRASQIRESPALPVVPWVKSHRFPFPLDTPVSPCV